MRPLHIEMDGFGAFRDRAVVDFDGVDFFALVGPTGSGKSTVLDAVCFALYGAVPRYDDERLIAPVLSLGAVEARVSLRFESGGEAYVVTRVVRRQKDKVGTKEQRLERVTGATTEVLASGREVTARVEQVVGLSFAHFTKCVLLPQGEFARFLHDKPAERQEVLVKLLDLGVYAAMARAAKGRADLADAAAQLAAQRRADLGDVGDGALAAAQARVTAVAGAREVIRDAVGETERLTEEARLLSEEGRAAVTLLEALGRVAVPPDATRLADALDVARRDAQAAAEREVAARDAVAAAAATVAALPALDELRLLEAAHRDRDGALDRRPALVAERDAASVRSAERQGEVAAAEAARAAVVAAGEEALRVASAAFARAEAALSACVPAGQLALAERAHAELAGAEDERSALERSLHDADGAVATAGARVAEADRAFSAARAAREAAETAHAAHVVAERLVVGDPCPACGETVTAVPATGASPPSLDAARAAEATADKERVAARQLATAADARRATVAERLSALSATIERLRAELGGYVDRSVLDRAARARAEAEAGVEQARHALDRVRTQNEHDHQRAAAEVVAATTRATEAATALAAAEAAVKAVDGELARYDDVLAGRPDAAAVASDVERVQQAMAAVDAARKEADQARTELDARRAAVAERERAVASARERFDAQRMAVAALDPPVPAAVDLVGDWQALVDWAAATAVAQQALVDAKRARAAELSEGRRAAYDRALVAAAGAGVPAPTGADLAQLRDAVVGHATRVEAELARIQTNRARDAELAEEEVGQRQTAAVAQDLARLLNARNFEKWLVSTALRVLAEGASAILERLSAGAYALTLDAGDDFAVIDHRNADEVRPARTLSGGETFQASLALALALAEQLQGLSADPNRRLEAIFLDEGFGTLDADTLETVAATIETLGADGRMVGIVTHVRELAERVPVRYVVTRGTRSSHVERVEV